MVEDGRWCFNSHVMWIESLVICKNMFVKGYTLVFRLITVIVIWYSHAYIHYQLSSYFGEIYYPFSVCEVSVMKCILVFNGHIALSLFSFHFVSPSWNKIWHWECSPLPNMYLLIHLCVWMYAAREGNNFFRKLKLATWTLVLLRLLYMLFLKLCSLSKILRKLNFIAKAVYHISSIIYISFVLIALLLLCTGLYRRVKINGIDDILMDTVISLCNPLLYYLFDMPLQFLREKIEFKIDNARAKHKFELSDKTYCFYMYYISIVYFFGVLITLYIIALVMYIRDYTNDYIEIIISIFFFSSLILWLKHIYYISPAIKHISSLFK